MEKIIFAPLFRRVWCCWIALQAAGLEILKDERGDCFSLFRQVLLSQAIVIRCIVRSRACEIQTRFPPVYAISGQAYTNVSPAAGQGGIQRVLYAFAHQCFARLAYSVAGEKRPCNRLPNCGVGGYRLEMPSGGHAALQNIDRGQLTPRTLTPCGRRRQICRL